MNKLKNWIIKKLGGIILEDLPAEIKIAYLRWLANNTTDKNLVNILKYEK
jgi:hypothetical protein